MKLVRKLLYQEPPQSGDDVRELQSELIQIGFEIPRTEITSRVFGKGTLKAVLEFQRKHDLEITGIVDDVTAKLINDVVDAIHPGSFPPEKPVVFFVVGQISNSDGTPLANGFVRAFDRDMRSEEFLGETKSDNNGKYRIEYTSDKLSRAEKRSADLRVSVSNDAGLELATSPIHFNSPPVTSINLVVGEKTRQRRSEFERYVNELTPLKQGISFEDLMEDNQSKVRENGNPIRDISFLAAETGLNPGHISFLVVSHKLAKETQIGAQIFYGLFRQGLPTALPALLLRSKEIHRSALDSSIRKNIIPVPHDIDNILAGLQQLIGKYVLNPTDGRQKIPVVDLLQLSHLEEPQQEKFLQLWSANKGSIEEFWKAVKDEPDLKNGQLVEELQLILQLGLLTGNNIPLVKALKEVVYQKKTAQPARSIRYLTNLNAISLTELIMSADGALESISSRIPGETKQEKLKNYVNIMIELLSVSFPTTSVRRNMAEVPRVRISQVKMVLAQNPTINLSHRLPENLNWGDMSARRPS